MPNSLNFNVDFKDRLAQQKKTKILSAGRFRKLSPYKVYELKKNNYYDDKSPWSVYHNVMQELYEQYYGRKYEIRLLNERQATVLRLKGYEVEQTSDTCLIEVDFPVKLGI